ncbi:MAG: glycoside hydrolase family 2 TIM barrel-domain containing protein [Bacteroidota bacterium]|nr:glycoside hydrolase family 2 TIM barrel-domain containing protein [Bacteroidota bacterium]
MKKIIFLVAAFFSLPVIGAFAAGNPRQRILFDDDWRFYQGDRPGAEQIRFDDGKWRLLDLPHDWSIEGNFDEKAATTGRGGYLPAGIGWYRKSFDLPANTAGKNAWIEFDGVYMNSEVWINGHYLGKYPNGYMSFYYDLTPYLKKKKNLIAVRVDNSQQPNSRWYSGSGIYRHVWLNIADPLHIVPWGTYITTPSVDSAVAVVSIRSSIDNGYKTSKNITLRSLLIDESGRETGRAESSLVIDNGTSKEVQQTIHVNSPALWSVESPHLYTLRTEILMENKVIDETITPFGIREIRYDAVKGFFLNGKRIKLNGVCLHHDAGSVGAAVPIPMWEQRFSLLKEMGCNAIRTSHNPEAPEFMDLCDKMGFLVMDEIFDEWTQGKVEQGYHNYFKEWSQRDLVNFIHRDRNHPSVVIWSAGNEIGEQKMEKGYEILRSLVETFHREDPTRPVTTGNDNIAADNGSATLPFLQSLDIVGYNYVDRWHERRELFYSIDKQAHPEWKMIGTESVSIPGIRGNYYGGGFGGIDSSVIRAANMSGVIRAEQLWKFVSSHDYVIGDFMWTGIDYLGEARWPAKSSSSGVIDLCGFPKDAYYFYQSQWTGKPMIHISPHWNWQGHEGQVIPVLIYTNCDSVELFLNDKSFGIKSLQFPRVGNSGAWNRYDVTPVYTTTGDLHLTWDVPYQPGTLKAVGRKGGKIVVTEQIKTTGAPAKIMLLPDSGHGDTEDVKQIVALIKDADGNTVPTASNEVKLTIEGEGKLIGFDNGNPFDHTNMKSPLRKVFNGMALAIIQSNRKAGIIRIKAESAGLPDTVIEIKSSFLPNFRTGTKE